MVDMDKKEQILHYHRIDGLSQREIARRVGVSRKTVKRYITEYETLAQADSEDGINMCLASEPKYPSRKIERTRLTEPVCAEIEYWLSENAKRRLTGMRKQCLKKQDIHRAPHLVHFLVRFREARCYQSHITDTGIVKSQLIILLEWSEQYTNSHRFLHFRFKQQFGALTLKQSLSHHLSCSAIHVPFLVVVSRYQKNVPTFSPLAYIIDELPGFLILSVHTCKRDVSADKDTVNLPYQSLAFLNIFKELAFHQFVFVIIPRYVGEMDVRNLKKSNHLATFIINPRFFVVTCLVQEQYATSIRYISQLRLAAVVSRQPIY